MNLWENIIYAGYAIYGGWLTAATILNCTLFLTKAGVTAADFGWTDSSAGVAILGVASGLYVAIAWYF